MSKRNSCSHSCSRSSYSCYSSDEDNDCSSDYRCNKSSNCYYKNEKCQKCESRKKKKCSQKCESRRTKECSCKKKEKTSSNSEEDIETKYVKDGKCIIITIN